MPIVAILDTNCDPDEVAFPIPGNDDSIRSVSLLTRVVADAVAEGLMERHNGKSNAAEEPMAEWERELLEQHEGHKSEQAAPAAEAPAAEQAAPAAPAETEQKDAPAAE